MVKGYIFIIVILSASLCFGQLTVSGIFGDNMVLQENMKVPIWGTSKADAKVSIEASWLDNEETTVADAKGKWKIFLPTSAASFDLHTIRIISEGSIVKLNGILIGQVWLCSGQSNMEFTLNKEQNASTEIPKADFPFIRLYQGKNVFSVKPLSDVKGQWQVCKPDTASNFSAVGYYFGKELFQKINKPIGLINFSWGGTPVETWMSPQGLALFDKYTEYLNDYWAKRDMKYAQSNERYDIELAQWEEDIKAGKNIKKPATPRELRLQDKPNACYNGVIAPIKGFAIAGVIWYQGEANTGSAKYPYYYDVFPGLIKDWRNLWQQGDFPFLYVQLAASKGYGVGVSHIRQAQMLALNKVSNIGMAVTMDIGYDRDHHPLNKKDVGYRLSLWALKNTYGMKDIICSGPLYKSKKIEGEKIRVFFDYVGDGLIAQNGDLTDFAVCGQDFVFYSAKAIIDGSTILVWSDKVAEPEEVSFAWCEYAEPNFYNKNGLPASPFNTRELEILR